jgi:hypothetical protein
MAKISSPAEILTYAKDNNWLALTTSEGNILNVFLTPAGNIVEIYFEKGKTTIKVLPYYVCK